MTSAVLIIPTDWRDAANAVGMALGWGPQNYTIALSDNGLDVTHWGCRFDPQQSFLDMLQAPPLIPGIADVLAVLIVELSDDLTNDVHLAAAIAKHGMVRIEQPEN
jgi:hypothetical protein